MRKSFTSAALLLCLWVAACDKAPNVARNSNVNQNEEANGGGNTNSPNYRFKTATCDTYERRFETKTDLCYAIQIGEINNDCASAERLAYFAQNCANITTYDPVKAKDALIHVDGDYVTCTLKETGGDRILQYTANRNLVMEHTITNAIVTHTVNDGKVSLNMQLYNGTTGQLIAEKRKTWKDESETVTISAPIANGGTSVLTCLVSLADDTTRN